MPSSQYVKSDISALSLSFLPMSLVKSLTLTLSSSTQAGHTEETGGEGSRRPNGRVEKVDTPALPTSPFQEPSTHTVMCPVGHLSSINL